MKQHTFNVFEPDHVAEIMRQIGFEPTVELLSTIVNMANEYQQEGWQDCYRARLLGCVVAPDLSTQEKIELVLKSNGTPPRTEYEALMGGDDVSNEDRYVIITDWTVWEIGCSYGG